MLLGREGLAGMRARGKCDKDQALPPTQGNSYPSSTFRTLPKAQQSFKDSEVLCSGATAYLSQCYWSGLFIFPLQNKFEVKVSIHPGPWSHCAGKSCVPAACQVWLPGQVLGQY